MAQETELKLLVRPQDAPALLAHPLLATQIPHRQRLLNTYFDTPELALMQQRVAVRERRVGRRTLLTVKTAGTSVGGLSQRGEWEAPTRPGAPDFAALVSEPALAAQLQALAPRLLPLFRTDFVRQHWLIGHAGAQIEVALDKGTISTGGPTGHTPRREPILELELELKQGPEAALWSLAQALAGAGRDAHQAVRLLPSDRSKAQRGLALYRGQPVQPQKAPPPALRPDMGARAAFRTAAGEALAQWLAHVEGLLATPADAASLPDPEFIHQARVALRRLRTILRLFADDLPDAFVRRWRAFWRSAAPAMGAARDWDVLDAQLLDWISAQARQGEPPERWQALADWALAQRQAAHQRAVAQLLAPRLAQQLLRFAAELQALPDLHERGRKRRQADARDLGAWARKVLGRRLKTLRRQASKAHRLDLDGLHRLRIRCKKLRYAQHCLAPLLPDTLRAQAEALARAQDTLGRLNDLVTIEALMQPCPVPGQRDWLQHLAHERARILRRLPRLQNALRDLATS